MEKKKKVRDPRFNGLFLQRDPCDDNNNNEK